jgi:hypothetical protein
VKAPLTPDKVPALHAALSRIPDARMQVSAGGNVAFVSTPHPSTLEAALRTLNMQGMTLRGDAPLWLGERPRPGLTHTVKEALDPQHRFPSLDD